MGLQRGIDGGDGTDPVGGAARVEHLHRVTREAPVAVGTLACPRCDAPVAPAGPLHPAAPIACPYCAHPARVRDFLTLGAPTRAAHVVVRVVHR